MTKKILFLMIALSCGQLFVAAQPILSTKSARVRFFSSTPAENIEAINTQAVSKLDQKSGQLSFMLLIKGFVMENELMQKHFNEEYLESDKFPKSDFKGRIINIAAVNFAKNGVYPVIAEGYLTIHGTTQKVKATGTATINNGKCALKSIFKIKVTDFKISGSDIGKSIAKELEITVNSQYD